MAVGMASNFGHYSRSRRSKIIGYRRRLRPLVQHWKYGLTFYSSILTFFKYYKVLLWQIRQMFWNTNAYFFQGKMYPQKLIKYPFSLKIIAKTVLLMFGEEENFTYFCIDIWSCKSILNLNLINTQRSNITFWWN